MNAIRQVDQAFSLFGTTYIITWKDDDGEVTSIHSDDDLIETVNYFQVGDDAPLSSAASILSGRSFSNRKITIRVNVNMEYEGPSLSDTSSLASFDDFMGRNGSQHSFSIEALGEPEDDSVTVSSKDFGSNLRRHVSNPFDKDDPSGSFVSPMPSFQGHKDYDQELSRDSQEASSFTLSGGSLIFDAANRYPEDPSAILEQLKLQDTLSDASSVHRNIGENARGQAWLKEQGERAIVYKLGRLPQPSESDGTSPSLNDGLDGDLALERNNRGSYYYTYTASSQSHDEGPEPGQSENGILHESAQPRPSSMHLHWVAAQQASVRRDLKPSPSALSLNIYHSFLPLSEPSEHILTDCSNCGIMLNTIRYVCSTCGEKEPKQKITASKGKARDITGSQTSYAHRNERDFSSIMNGSYENAYPPPPPSANAVSSSSPTVVGSFESLSPPQQQSQCLQRTRYPPPPPHPQRSHYLPSQLLTPSPFGLGRPSDLIHPHIETHVTVTVGYELCPQCIDTAGRDHAIFAAIPGPVVLSSSGDPQQALSWRKAAPKKGHLRHAYHEKLWGQRGWENVGKYGSFFSHAIDVNLSAPQFRKKVLYQHVQHVPLSHLLKGINALCVPKSACAKRVIGTLFFVCLISHSDPIS